MTCASACFYNIYMTSASSCMHLLTSYTYYIDVFSRIHWTFECPLRRLQPCLVLLACCHPALIQSECEENVPTA